MIQKKHEKQHQAEEAERLRENSSQIVPVSNTEKSRFKDRMMQRFKG